MAENRRTGHRVELGFDIGSVNCCQMKIKTKSNCVTRRGAQVVELALILPVILVLTLGTLEICQGYFLRQKLEIAAHEGARVAILKSANTQLVEEKVAEYLDARSLNYDDIGSVVTVSPAPELADELEAITVSVTLSISDNLRLPLSLHNFLSGDSFTTEVVMYKEYRALD